LKNWQVFLPAWRTTERPYRIAGALFHGRLRDKAKISCMQATQRQLLGFYEETQW